MSLYDPDNPQHRRHMDRQRASWTAADEAALQERFAREGIGTPGWAAFMRSGDPKALR